MKSKTYDLTKIKQPEVEKRLIDALEKLSENDEHLFHNNTHERSIAHKLAMYLEDEFKDWDIDVEYNRVGTRKPIAKQITNPYKAKPTNVYPDIIIHERGKNNNLVAIEIKKDKTYEKQKKDKRNIEFKKMTDIEKLEEYKIKYKYKFCVYLNFITDKKVKKPYVFYFHSK